MPHRSNKLKPSKTEELLENFEHLKESVAAVVFTNKLKEKYLTKNERGRYLHNQSETTATSKQKDPFIFRELRKVHQSPKFKTQFSKVVISEAT